ncbi:S8 family serine peptidase [Fontimonas sp. SYSU GA230001]|uniref:S8 family serine peptidase n=1 Tax=Fontimonas sp. SYSU GA230001 TaxID=3142450 RepID=UPI0032B5AFA5
MKAFVMSCAVAALAAGISAPAGAGPLGGGSQPTLSAAAAQPIANQYIVTLAKLPPESPLAALDVGALAQTLAVQFGGQVIHVYEHALRGFAIRLPDAAAPLLALHPAVAAIERDQLMHAVGTQSGATWGIDRIDQRDRPLDGSYRYPDAAGQGVHVYVIDTGINPNHVEFTGRVSTSRNFVAGTLGSADPNAWTDCNGHGTHVSGTAAGTSYGVAKQATLHAVRVLDCQGSGSNSGVIAGVDWVTANHVKPAVANMSLGGGDSSALDTAVKNAIAAGVTMAVAAGNDTKDACAGSPNKVPEAITVGASTNTDAVASYSNRGTCLDLFAPGSDIVSANYSNNTGSTTMSGTSMASPHVAGAAALYLGANPNLTPAQLRDRMVADSSANKLSGTGAGGNFLTGTYGASPNRLLYVGDIAGGGGTPTDNPPVAAFTYSCTDLACSFDGSASTDDKGIAAYGWTFGDSTGGSGATVAHSYAAGGIYTVTLTVTDTVGQTASSTQTVSVTAPGGSAPCSNCTKSSGTLASGGTGYVPSSNGFSSPGGTFKGWLRGPATADFDLYLEKLSSGLLGSSWSIVARGETTSSNEDISYSGTSGTYRWRIKAYSGSGSYDLYVSNP